MPIRLDLSVATFALDVLESNAQEPATKQQVVSDVSVDVVRAASWGPDGRLGLWNYTLPVAPIVILCHELTHIFFFIHQE
jgi:hypothetical protein